MCKRLFDLFFTCIGIVLLSPLFIVIAILIKLDDKSGPVFYRQVRVGLHGKLFKIFKFRSMRVGADRNGLLTVGADSRITKVGHFIRKYKIDELPQLFNVFLGQMSLVGPRPEVEEYMNHYPNDIRNQILSVKPGITDWASIEMIDENNIISKYDDAKKAYIEIIMPIKQSYYLKYASQNNVLIDLHIIIRTILKIFGIS
jgi:lipopolysaccharide/colanic/teichoic acid biosynthesis glycosyltransferase